uniref:NADH-ubiquinone oxidoreductase chain 4 n=1 Tax=Palinurellus wieneckii TaxID=198231 RepID=S4V390_PALWI|nr:NADH dehydrogenase subunit 4 [Palinurellus wieneckii]AGN95859.1 NADH dehydrogenase subunit 4 [Palinurellus wieneckii]
MLKFLFLNILLMSFISSWEIVQVLMFVFCFVIMMSWNGNFSFFNLGCGLGVDCLSYVLILLSSWILALMICSSQKVMKTGYFSGGFLSVNLFLMSALLMAFSSMNYLLFYISFESSLIPTLILILGWGYQPERIQAGIYMLFYTLLASMPLLVCLLSLYNSNGSLTMGITPGVLSDSFSSILWYMSAVLAFVVKLPMYMFHLWLPKAHVEAPVAGSMILAGVLLKLGGYGIIRILCLFPSLNKKLVWVWVCIGLVGGAIVSLMCLRQVDVKSLIAYSSVAHMGLVLCGLMTSGWWGVNGAVVVMVGHGLCSSGLFCIANMVYERIGSRSMLIGKGLLSFMPSMGLWWFLLSISNMAAPPSLNLLGEIQLISSLVGWSNLSMIAISALSFFSASYTVYMYSLSQHGVYYSPLFSCSSGKVREYMILMLHWLPLNFLILKTGLIFYLFCLSS